jgi:hypothetical protein
MNPVASKTTNPWFYNKSLSVSAEAEGENRRSKSGGIHSKAALSN